MNRLELHRVLSACLTEPTAIAARLRRQDFPWEELLAAANHALLSPALCVALRRASLLPVMPESVGSYLAELCRLNQLRNDRLRHQLMEAVRALNDRGTVPLLLKGAAILFTSDDGYASGRMVTDLDILVPPEQSAGALAVFAMLGYRRTTNRAPRHTLGDFARPRDVGAVDLHVALLNRPSLLPLEEVFPRTAVHEAEGLRVRLLSPTDRVLHLLLHDLVQDQGLHDGRLNIRHLHELADLAVRQPIDWDTIRAHLARHRLDRALEVWLLAAATFFGGPSAGAVSFGARVLHWRALASFRYPRLRRANEIFGNLHQSLSWYRLTNRERKAPRIRRAAEYLRTYRARTARRILHVLLDHRS